MFGFFRRRRSAEAEAVAALLFAHVEAQLRESGQLDGNPVSPVARSFWLHDYMTGLVTAAEQAGRLRRSEGRRAFTSFMENVIGMPPSAARSCYATSRGHCRSNPKEEAFLEGIADAEALLAGHKPQPSIARRFSPPRAQEDPPAPTTPVTMLRPEDRSSLH
jgi:hypothetical protein